MLGWQPPHRELKILSRITTTERRAIRHAGDRPHPAQRSARARKDTDPAKERGEEKERAAAPQLRQPADVAARRRLLANIVESFYAVTTSENYEREKDSSASFQQRRVVPSKMLRLLLLASAQVVVGFPSMDAIDRAIAWANCCGAYGPALPRMRPLAEATARVVSDEALWASDVAFVSGLDRWLATRLLEEAGDAIVAAER